MNEHVFRRQVSMNVASSVNELYSRQYVENDVTHYKCNIKSLDIKDTYRDPQ
jgi:hypothetical protein